MDFEPELPEGEELDTTEDLDLVTVFRSNTNSAEMESMVVRGMLEAGGIPAVVLSTSEFPSLPFEVRVPRARAEEALHLIAESEAAGPGGAEEAEESTEDPGRA